MNPKYLQKSLVLFISLTLLLLSFVPAPANAAVPITGNGSGTTAVTSTANLPTFERLVAAVTDGQAGVVRGVYVPGVLAMRVMQQPADNPGYVSAVTGIATQFQYAAANGVTGLLAHNYSSGALFFGLAPGQEVRVVYGDGTIRRYSIVSISRYQALEPNSPYSDFVDLNTGDTLSATDVFNLHYGGGHHVTFQTCIWRDGNPVWGRIFVVAIPLN